MVVEIRRQDAIAARDVQGRRPVGTDHEARGHVTVHVEEEFRHVRDGTGEAVGHVAVFLAAAARVASHLAVPDRTVEHIVVTRTFLYAIGRRKEEKVGREEMEEEKERKQGKKGKRIDD